MLYRYTLVIFIVATKLLVVIAEAKSCNSPNSVNNENSPLWSTKSRLMITGKRKWKKNGKDYSAIKENDERHKRVPSFVTGKTNLNPQSPFVGKVDNAINYFSSAKENEEDKGEKDIYDKTSGKQRYSTVNSKLLDIPHTSKKINKKVSYLNKTELTSAAVITSKYDEKPVQMRTASNKKNCVIENPNKCNLSGTCLPNFLEGLPTSVKTEGDLCKTSMPKDHKKEVTLTQDKSKTHEAYYEPMQYVKDETNNNHHNYLQNYNANNENFPNLRPGNNQQDFLIKHDNLNTDSLDAQALPSMDYHLKNNDNKIQVKTRGNQNNDFLDNIITEKCESGHENKSHYIENAQKALLDKGNVKQSKASKKRKFKLSKQQQKYFKEKLNEIGMMTQNDTILLRNLTFGNRDISDGSWRGTVIKVYKPQSEKGTIQRDYELQRGEGSQSNKTNDQSYSCDQSSQDEDQLTTVKDDERQNYDTNTISNDEDINDNNMDENPEKAEELKQDLYDKSDDFYSDSLDGDEISNGGGDQSDTTMEPLDIDDTLFVTNNTWDQLYSMGYKNKSTIDTKENTNRSGNDLDNLQTTYLDTNYQFSNSTNVCDSVIPNAEATPGNTKNTTDLNENGSNYFFDLDFNVDNDKAKSESSDILGKDSNKTQLSDFAIKNVVGMIKEGLNSSLNFNASEKAPLNKKDRLFNTVHLTQKENHKKYEWDDFRVRLGNNEENKSNSIFENDEVEDESKNEDENEGNKKDKEPGNTEEDEAEEKQKINATDDRKQESRRNKFNPNKLEFNLKKNDSEVKRDKEKLKKLQINLDMGCINNSDANVTLQRIPPTDKIVSDLGQMDTTEMKSNIDRNAKYMNRKLHENLTYIHNIHHNRDFKRKGFQKKTHLNEHNKKIAKGKIRKKNKNKKKNNCGKELDENDEPRKLKQSKSIELSGNRDDTHFCIKMNKILQNKGLQSNDIDKNSSTEQDDKVSLFNSDEDFIFETSESSSPTYKSYFELKANSSNFNQKSSKIKHKIKKDRSKQTGQKITENRRSLSSLKNARQKQSEIKNTEKSNEINQINKIKNTAVETHINSMNTQEKLKLLNKLKNSKEFLLNIDYPFASESGGMKRAFRKRPNHTARLMKLRGVQSSLRPFSNDTQSSSNKSYSDEALTDIQSQINRDLIDRVIHLMKLKIITRDIKPEVLDKNSNKSIIAHKEI